MALEDGTSSEHAKNYWRWNHINKKSIKIKLALLSQILFYSQDFANGRILFVAEPPEVDASFDRNRWLAETEKTMMRQERVAERVAVQKLKDLESAEQLQRDTEDDDEFVFGDGEYDDEDAQDDVRVFFKFYIHWN